MIGDKQSKSLRNLDQHLTQQISGNTRDIGDNRRPKVVTRSGLEISYKNMGKISIVAVMLLDVSCHVISIQNQGKSGCSLAI